MVQFTRSCKGLFDNVMRFTSVVCKNFHTYLYGAKQLSDACRTQISGGIRAVLLSEKEGL